MLFLSGLVGRSGCERKPDDARSKPELQPGTKRDNSGMPYVWIPSGEFQMGCLPKDTECGDDEKPPHEVRISRGFWLGQTEVTQAAYQTIQRNNPSHFKGEDLPVEGVT